MYNEICSVYAEHILIEDLETGCNFLYADWHFQSILLKGTQA
jgi:hypothetical protein